VLAARAWTLSASPTILPTGSAATVTLTVQNVGSSSGGDEITCVRVSVPSAFSVSAATIVSVKGITSATVHGWVVVTGSATGTTIVTFKNPPDKNPLVGLPIGDSAVFRVSGTAASPGLLTWTAVAADKPGGATSTSCGSGTFPTISVALTIGSASTPTPTATPTPPPTPTPTPVPTPTPAPTPTQTPRLTPAPTATPSPKPTWTPPGSPTPTSSPTPAPTDSGLPHDSPVPSSDPGAASGPGRSTAPPGSPAPGFLGTGGTPSSGPDTTDPFVVPVRSPGHGVPEVIGGLDATVRSALLDVGLIGWTVPALALSVPGILVVIVVALQLIGGAAWLPVARRMLSRMTGPVAGARPAARRDAGRSGR
jgi:hypothetical protein